MVVPSPQDAENTAFLSGFPPLAEPTAETFSWLSLWNFKEKSISHFLWHRQRKKKGKEAPANLDVDAPFSPSLAKRKASLSYVVLLYITI
ncbi:hypothetical protein [uncultured Bilophila sp.]|uniref:hypothetical protein n=1 Tax=uncultured Bilophila sp. TaxID=529385 RepID=UPI00266FDC7A|nr:hypothetical protein [uncultured Bilophila sp.]